MNSINRLYTKDIHEQFAKLIPLITCWRWDKVEHEYFVEIQDCHFIADSKFIVEHSKIHYDRQWYIDNYDPLINTKQFTWCINNLVNDIYSRKSFLYMGDKTNNSICTTGMQMILQYDRLNWIVNMRSNNVIKYTTDYEWQMSWAIKACQELTEKLGRNIELGTIYWNACSMHVFDEDFELFLKNIYS